MQVIDGGLHLQHAARTRCRTCGHTSAPAAGTSAPAASHANGMGPLSCSAVHCVRQCCRKPLQERASCARATATRRPRSEFSLINSACCALISKRRTKQMGQMMLSSWSSDRGGVMSFTGRLPERASSPGGLAAALGLAAAPVAASLACSIAVSGLGESTCNERHRLIPECAEWLHSVNLSLCRAGLHVSRS